MVGHLHRASRRRGPPDEAFRTEELQRGMVRDYGQMLKQHFPDSDVRPKDFVPGSFPPNKPERLRPLKARALEPGAAAPRDVLSPGGSGGGRHTLKPVKSTHHPTVKARKQLDYSFVPLADMSDALRVVPRDGPPAKPGADGDLRHVRALLFAGCGLRNAAPLVSVVKALVHNGLANLTSLNLSQNSLTEVPDCIVELQSLGVLHLQCNRISHVRQILKLAPMTTLQVLSTSGNPVEESPYYRETVVRALPELRSLNAAAITTKDRHTMAHCPSRLPASKLLSITRTIETAKAGSSSESPKIRR